MQRHTMRSVSRGLLALAIVALPLAGCSSTGGDAFGAFGGGSLEKVDIVDVQGYTADRALSEARAHFRLGDFGYSAALYKRYAELTPTDPEGYVGLAASYDRLRRFDLADRVYAALLRLTGGTAQYYNNVGFSHLLRGDTATALADLRKANGLDPQNAVIANNLKMVAYAAKRSRGQPQA